MKTSSLPDNKPEENHEKTFIDSPSENWFLRRVGFVEAVHITGRSKATISKDTASGKLAHEVSEDGKKLYKVFDLHTLYGLREPKQTKQKEVYELDKNHEKPDEKTLENKLLAQKVEFLEQQIEALKAEKEELREHISNDREQLAISQNREKKLLEIVDRQTLLLSPPAPTVSPEPVEAPRRSWFSRWFGK